jgi:hypothetical protein
VPFPAYLEDIYRLSFDEGPDKQDWGTCFPILLEHTPRFVTAAHVFDKLNRPTTATVSFCSPAHAEQTHQVQIRYLACDVAIVLPCWVPLPRCLPTSIIPLSNMVVLIGYPQTLSGTMPTCAEQYPTKGVINDTRTSSSCTAYSMNMLTGATGPGNSGGPVFDLNDHGESVSVIGVLSGGGTDAAQANNMIATRIDSAFR